MLHTGDIMAKRDIKNGEIITVYVPHEEKPEIKTTIIEIPKYGYSVMGVGPIVMESKYEQAPLRDSGMIIDYHMASVIQAPTSVRGPRGPCCCCCRC